MSQNAKGKYVHKISTIYMKEEEITKMEFEEITEEEETPEGDLLMIRRLMLTNTIHLNFLSFISIS